MGGRDGAELRHRHLEIGEHLQEEGLERLVGAVELVDQQDRGAGRIRLERLQERPLDQKALGKDIMLQPLAIVLALGFRDPDGDHLRRIVPFVDGSRHVEPFIALQADEAPPERCGEHLGDFGLADAGLAFEKQRPSHLKCEEQHGRERAIGQIVGRGQEIERRIDRDRQRFDGRLVHELNLMRRGRRVAGRACRVGVALMQTFREVGRRSATPTS